MRYSFKCAICLYLYCHKHAVHVCAYCTQISYCPGYANRSMYFSYALFHHCISFLFSVCTFSTAGQIIKYFMEATYPYIEDIITRTIMSNCNVCLNRVLMHSYNLTCDICNSSVHVKCLPWVNKNDPLFTKRHENFFYCSLCLRDILAFNHFEDDEFIEAISESWENRPLASFDMLDNQGLIFSPFDLNDKFDNPLHEVDADIQFYDKHCTG